MFQNLILNGKFMRYTDLMFRKIGVKQIKKSYSL